MRHKLDRSYGFTLIELIVSISLAAILMSMAIPSFIGTIGNNRLTTVANELLTSINFARSEAVKRGVQVTIERLSPTSQVWEGGWKIYVDIASLPAGNVIGTFQDDGDSTLCEVNAVGAPTEDCLLKSYPALTNGFTLRTGANYANWVAYLPSGLSTSSTNFGNDTFRLCDSSADTSKSRAIAIIATGRARVDKPASSCP
jgi:type IV fimbrial biogenesis protein FimT